MRKIKCYTLCDTSYIAPYEDYVENCKINEVEPDEKDSDSYWDFVNDMQSMEWDDLEINLSSSEQAQQPVLITGTLGLWNGTRPSIPTRCETLWNAIQKCANNVDHIKVKYYGGVVYVEGTHHDGTNKWEIYKLSKKGIEATFSWEDGKSPNGDCRGYWKAKYHGFLY